MEVYFYVASLPFIEVLVLGDQTAGGTFRYFFNVIAIGSRRASGSPDGEIGWIKTTIEVMMG